MYYKLKGLFPIFFFCCCLQNLVAQTLNYNSWHSQQDTSSQQQNSRAITVESFGAVGNEIDDDTKAFQAAFTYARSHGLVCVNLSSGKKYKITNYVDIDYRGMGQIDRKGIQLNGNGASILLSTSDKGNGYYAFNILTDPLPQQNTKFNINNVWFYTDNVNRPNGIYNSSACFVSIQNCVFYQLSVALNFENAGMCRIDNCYFWGCEEGIKTYRCRDTYVDGCHAYACDRAYHFEGINNAGSDGNISIVNSVANGSTQFNLMMKGLYTPMVANCVFEQSPINLLIQSCSFGKMSNIFSGPGNVNFVATKTDLTNDYWNIANFDAQGKIEFNGLKFSNITGLKIHGVGSANNKYNAALQLNNCYELNFSALTIRDSRDKLAWSMFIAKDCSSITISNMIADRSLCLQGSVVERPGRFFLTAAILNGSVESEGHQYKRSEIFDYIDSRDNTYHANKPLK